MKRCHIPSRNTAIAVLVKKLHMIDPSEDAVQLAVDLTLEARCINTTKSIWVCFDGASHLCYYDKQGKIITKEFSR